MREDDDDSNLQPALRPRPTAELNEMAVAVAASLPMWTLTPSTVILIGYHGSGPTNAINCLTVMAGILGFSGRRWQLRSREGFKRKLKRPF